MVTVPVKPAATPGFIGRIPVRNLWLLMLYASDLFRVQGYGKLGFDENLDELPDLLAEVLANAVEERQRRRLSLGYRRREDILTRVRGRIDVLRTARQQLLQRGQVACRYEELTIDTPRNRLVRFALESISRLVQRAALRQRCRRLANALQASGVSTARPSRSEMSTDQFGPHDAHDRYMVAAARLACDLTLPAEAAGRNFLALPGREEAWVRLLYERAVGGFFEVILDSKGWKVRPATRLDWQIGQRTAAVDGILPRMQTDIVLDDLQAGRRIVIDTKFTSILTSDRWQRDTLRSGYLYQIYAYLRSQAGGGDAVADRAEGVLLHPSVGKTLNEAVVIQGHCIRFMTVDLTASTAAIRADLLRVLDRAFASS
jgi:5-methylcytosine-specific restriction enzyme subunit McrC